MTQLELAYVGLEVADLSQAAWFFGDVVGLVPGEPTASGATTWRNDGKIHRLIVAEGSSNDASFVGFEASDRQAYDATLERLRAAGYAVEELSAAERAERRVRHLARAASPLGVPVEIVVGLEASDTPCSSALVPGGFLTEGVGFGHVVLASTDFDEACRFAVDGLGLRQSDWLTTEIAEGIPLEVRFFHCNERHHSLALARPPFELPQRLHHIMFEARDRDDVGAAFDRVWATDLAIPNGLGRHENDGMFSFYMASPFGFQIEIGHGARVVTPSWDDDRQYHRISLWGHQPLR